MADANINVKLIDALHIDYVAAAENGFDAASRAIWDALVVQFPTFTLNPLITSVDVASINDMMDAVRTQGVEPPSILNIFTLPCPDADVDAAIAALQASPFIEWAQVRPQAIPASLVHYGDDPLSERAFHLDPPPNGVDAIYAWNVAGGDGRGIRFVDVENGWSLTHEDLADAHVVRASTFGSPSAADIDHGTGVLGIVLGSDNGVGSVGMAPHCQGFVVTAIRADGISNVPDALMQAGFAVGSGGVLLIELANPFTPVNEPAIPIEFDRAVGNVMRLLAVFGVTVIEPAGNNGIDLDAFPFLSHMSRGSPGFFDTFAVMVGACLATTVTPAPGSTHGRRLDCFAPGRFIRAPSSTEAPPDHGYQPEGFSGTSASGAVIAGAAVALQGMALANTGDFLGAADMRRLLSDPAINVLSEHSTAANPNADGIGVLPDLHAIARHQGWAHIAPPAAVAEDANTMHILTIDDFSRSFSKQWQQPIGTWSGPLARGQFATPPEQAALVVRDDPFQNRMVVHALIVGVDTDIRYFWWDSLGQSAPNWLKKSDHANLSKSEPLVAGFSSDTRADVVCINREGRLVSLRAPVAAEVGDFSAPVEIDSALSFSGSAGPAIVESAPGALDVVAIDTDGRLRWTALNAGTAGEWDFAHPIGGVATRLARTLRPALAARGTNLDVVAVGVDQLLYTASKPDPNTLGWTNLRQIGGTTPLAVEGSLAIVSRGANLLDLFAIDLEGQLRWTSTEASPFIDWIGLEPIGGNAFKLSTLGGVTAVTRTPNTMDVFVVAVDGTLLWLKGTAGQAWPALVPI